MIHEWCAIIYGLGNCNRHTLYCDSLFQNSTVSIVGKSWLWFLTSYIVETMGRCWVVFRGKNLIVIFRDFSFVGNKQKPFFSLIFFMSMEGFELYYGPLVEKVQSVYGPVHTHISKNPKLVVSWYLLPTYLLAYPPPPLLFFLFKFCLLYIYSFWLPSLVFTASSYLI